MTYQVKFIVALIAAVISGSILLDVSRSISATAGGAVAFVAALIVFGASAATATYFYTRRHDSDLSTKQADLLRHETEKLQAAKREDSDEKNQ